MVAKILRKSSGIAVFEILPLLVMFVAFIGLTLGLWGAIHSGILQSIAARHYAFEVINHRTHFYYHRDFDTSSSSKLKMISNTKTPHESKFHHPENYGLRFFAIVALQESGDPSALVANRGINFFSDLNRKDEEDVRPGAFNPVKQTDQPSFHQNLFDRDIKAERVNPIWLMQGYGICLNAICGDRRL